MTGRLLHLSDLHVGRNDGAREELEDAVRLLVTELAPELIVCTGDLSHRNRPEQHARAAAFLRSLDRPLLVVPGNHDLPALPPARLSTPFTRFAREWGELEPTYLSETLAVAALNSVRPLKYQRGALDHDQVEHAAAVLTAAAPSALRVVALHHHLAGAPWRTGKRTIPRRTGVLGELAEAGVDLIVSGHTHQGLVVSWGELAGGAGTAAPVIAVAPGLGRPRPSRHHEACGVNVYEQEQDRRALAVRTYAWRAMGFVTVAERSFLRTPAGG